MDNVENPGVVEKANYIKPYAIVKLGMNIARVIADGYNSESAEDKLQFATSIMKFSEEELKKETKVKFIGDIMTRPKKERIKIANKIYLLLNKPVTNA